MNPNQIETRILLVDDHQIMRQGLRQLISVEPGMTVVGEASSGQSAKDQVRTLAPHMVLMDLHLPDECGVETTRQILAESPAVKVVALSSDSGPEMVLRALRAGVSGYLVKEDGSDELIRAIQTVMDHRFYLSPAVSSTVISQFTESSGRGKTGTATVELSERERMLLRLIAAGNRNKDIAAALAVTVKSAETYRLRLQKKLGCASTAELVRYAIRAGIVQA
jgi:DNA-binding NarL/FixJ family response regulator